MATSRRGPIEILKEVLISIGILIVSFFICVFEIIAVLICINIVSFKKIIRGDKNETINQ